MVTRINSFAFTCHQTNIVIRHRHHSSSFRSDCIERQTSLSLTRQEDGDDADGDGDGDGDVESKKVTLDNEEPLSLLFRRAVALHRAGALDEALSTYELFLKAAQQCNVSPEMYAEIHVNVGAIQLKRGDARYAKASFETALSYRSSIGTAHVNLALLILKELSSITDATKALRALQEAKEHCQDAMNVKDDPQSVAAATKILQDIDRMMSQTGFQ
jgi:tetratricopeptide (TPR) repeat protein